MTGRATAEEGVGAARRLPIGAEASPGGGVHFRVWAPRVASLEVVIESGPGAGAVCSLAREDGGYAWAEVPAAAAGSCYRFRLDGGDLAPDPASRFQPAGPHGPSQVVDPAAFPWTDGRWPGVHLEGQVIYEMHVGTFTPEGTWTAAAAQLPALADLGVTVLEVMPVADFPGRFGWGYDGVCLFAPTRLYGTPDDARRFVDRAHGLGLAVILDVVYNHLGPAGNCLPRFAPYFTDRHQTEWGTALDFDGPGSAPVREFFLANAAHWIGEYHLDGLRLDAVSQIFDASADHIVAAVARQVRTTAGGRGTIVVAEHEPQDVRLLRPPHEGGHGLDAAWNDDFHHAAMVALTGRRDAYYSDHRGAPQEIISALKWGYLFQGQRYRWQRQRRGTPTLGVPPARFVTYLQNHDQVANSLHGRRVHQLTSPGRLRAMTAVTLLGPGTPMLFQGQEFAASSPFLYFADHEGELGDLVRRGRARFLRQLPGIAAADAAGWLPDPGHESTFARSRLDPAERDRHRAAVTLHRDLLQLRRRDPVLRAQRPGGLDGAVLDAHAFAVRFFAAGGGDDRLLLVNLGHDLELHVAPEPLLAPPAGRCWRVIWSSEDPRYGGAGTPPLDRDGSWCVPGEAALLLAPVTSR